MSHSYPGNVRELKAAIELAVVMSDGVELKSSDLTFHNIGRETELLSEELTLDQYTQRIVDHFLEKYDHNVVLVANKLGIGKSTLYRMLKQEKESAT
jgi:DNA-binding NtrC family response regulator